MTPERKQQETMTPERWQQVKSVFNAVLEREPRERAAFLDSACGGDSELRREVESLVEAHTGAGSRYEAPVVSQDPMIGRQVGAYRILRRLGMGGMGAVYLASRADDQFRRLAAVKAIRPELIDDHTRRRFENERQTLAALEHPNIVKLLDGGTTEEGMPYLVMDYVEGQPIDRYCRDRALSIAERLALFRTLCGAVHYAHQNLLVHRDLKPANVLVTPQGIPKLLDFGIAKLLRPAYAAATIGFTRTVAQPMTPEYASPEQILGQPITTASDIYALGVLLYTLLAGTHPFSKQTQTAYELEKAICESEVGKPSDAAPPEQARQLRGDLDIIVQTAMRRQPQKRYASAEHLAEDVRRYLAGQPVTARGESLLYLAGKFYRRHRMALGTSLVAASLLAGLAIRDDLDRRYAEQRFGQLHKLARFVIHDLDEAMRKGITPARQKVVKQAVAYLDDLSGEARGNLGLQLDLVEGYLAVADIQGNPWGENLKQMGDARQSANKALELAEVLFRRYPQNPQVRSDLSDCHGELGDLLAKGAYYAQAIDRYQKALELCDSRPQCQNPYWGRIGYVQGELWDFAAARDSARKGEAAADEWLKQQPGDAAALKRRAIARERGAYFGAKAGDFAGAEDVILESIKTYESLPGARTDPGQRENIALAYKALAEVQKLAGKYEQALANCTKARDTSRALRAEDPQEDRNRTDIAQESVLLVELLRLSGRRDKAWEETVAELKDLEPLVRAEEPDRYYLVDYVALLTGPSAQSGIGHEAVAFAEKAVEMMRREDPETLDLLAQAYDGASRLQDAVDAEKRAIAHLPPVHPGQSAELARRILEESLKKLEAKIANTASQRPPKLP